MQLHRWRPQWLIILLPRSQHKRQHNRRNEKRSAPQNNCIHEPASLRESVRARFKMSHADVQLLILLVSAPITPAPLLATMPIL